MILYGYGFENQQKEEDILSDILFYALSPWHKSVLSPNIVNEYLIALPKYKACMMIDMIIHFTTDLLIFP